MADDDYHRNRFLSIRIVDRDRKLTFAVWQSISMNPAKPLLSSSASSSASPPLLISFRLGKLCEYSDPFLMRV